MQPSSIDALGEGRARRGGGSHGLAQQGEDSSVEKQRYYSLTLLPPKGCRCTFCEVKTSQNYHKISHGLSSDAEFEFASVLVRVREQISLHLGRDLG